MGLPFSSPEDLILFKVLAGRDKDLLDAIGRSVLVAITIYKGSTQSPESREFRPRLLQRQIISEDRTYKNPLWRRFLYK
jgi:hypothetical protein